ncbi:hypothetical protein AMATHDRAFT_51374 [Amanita thiersii Skay4041]|uniref:Aminoglycoside phosphotransferase domain-containing protein n=1 Tax=Amanita thiersii Skay4041 TaxID=703135 RepID=A0A2A9NE16_9AGAR|nr:hypothetical protein AMATHDRAFT_51374 [Amanita thiersii Skay4041]
MGVWLLYLWLLVSPALRLQAYQTLIRIGTWLYGHTDSPHRCFRLPFNLYAKISHKAGFNTMRYISEHITIPIPRVIDAIPVPNGELSIMTRLPGEPLGTEIYTMSKEERTLLAYDLKRCFDRLRSLPPPNSGPKICALGGGPIHLLSCTNELSWPL